MVGRCLATLLVCLLSAGCAPLILFGAGTAAGVTGYQYFDGTLVVLYQAPYMDTWDASLKALQEMNYNVRSSDHDTISGKIVAGGSEDKTVRLKVEYKTSKETEVSIRVGLLGNETASHAIKEKIRRVLYKV